MARNNSGNVAILRMPGPPAMPGERQSGVELAANHLFDQIVNAFTDSGLDGINQTSKRWELLPAL